ncbi:HPr family phosphocarrier protein [Bradyrhizobium sp. HKCCYLS20291]|uniref:HPr family phosphocarrier protein n=1 Tax=Bradyrhizobium sp. HKCCYLS20291 TaxID=3420766 RepID=UPI003EBE64C8
MSDEDAPQDNIAGPSVPADAISRELLITNKRGLHARASAKFVQMVEKFQAEVWVTRGGETVGGRSIMGLMMLAAAPGTKILVSAKGPEAEAALQAITDLVNDKFHEEGV